MSWIKKCKKCLNELHLSWEDVEIRTKEDMRKIRDRNNEEWRKGLEGRESLKFYRQWKIGFSRNWRSEKKDCIIKVFLSGNILTKGKLERIVAELGNGGY